MLQKLSSLSSDPSLLLLEYIVSLLVGLATACLLLVLELVDVDGWLMVVVDGCL